MLRELPNIPLTNVIIRNFCILVEFLREIHYHNLCVVLNLDSHKVAYYKNGNKTEYFDSFEKLQPSIFWVMT